MQFRICEMRRLVLTYCDNPITHMVFKVTHALQIGQSEHLTASVGKTNFQDENRKRFEAVFMCMMYVVLKAIQALTTATHILAC
jgi:hypothetical protein